VNLFVLYCSQEDLIVCFLTQRVTLNCEKNKLPLVLFVLCACVICYSVYVIELYIY